MTRRPFAHLSLVRGLHAHPARRRWAGGTLACLPMSPHPFLNLEHLVVTHYTSLICGPLFGWFPQPPMHMLFAARRPTLPSRYHPWRVYNLDITHGKLPAYRSEPIPPVACMQSKLAAPTHTCRVRWRGTSHTRRAAWTANDMCVGHLLPTHPTPIA